MLFGFIVGLILGMVIVGGFIYLYKKYLENK